MALPSPCGCRSSTILPRPRAREWAGIPAEAQWLCRAVSIGLLQPWEQGGDVGSEVLMGAHCVPTLAQLQLMLAVLCRQLAGRDKSLFSTLFLALPAQLDHVPSLQGPVNFLGLLCFPSPLGRWSSWLLPHCTGPGLVAAQCGSSLKLPR